VNMSIAISQCATLLKEISHIIYKMDLEKSLYRHFYTELLQMCSKLVTFVV